MRVRLQKARTGQETNHPSVGIRKIGGLSKVTEIFFVMWTAKSITKNGEALRILKFGTKPQLLPNCILLTKLWKPIQISIIQDLKNVDDSDKNRDVLPSCKVPFSDRFSSILGVHLEISFDFISRKQIRLGYQVMPGKCPILGTVRQYTFNFRCLRNRELFKF